MRQIFYFSITIFSLLICSLKMTSQTYSLTGNIVSTEGNNVVSGANVILENSNKTATTDAFGSFYFKDIKAGEYILKVNVIGFESYAKVIHISANSTEKIQLNIATIKLSEINIVSGKNISQSELITSVDKQLRPVNTAQDFLRLVPGLFIAQHAGGGKAEQIFLRGFDCDHGTDFYISIDGMPVNMVSHAHGQGYADFHFVIPETVDKLKVYKGPYAAKFGDFATSGSGEFLTKNHVDNSQIKVEAGNFDTYRLMTILNILGNKHLFTKDKKEDLYVAGEYVYTNSYFNTPQRFNRYNLFAKYTGTLNDKNILTLNVSTFGAKWNASGQVPERAVNEGVINRFGSIDSTEGGKTYRTNANLAITTAIKHNAVLKNQFYYVNYQFRLYSNFTFFLKNPVDGDEIAQTDSRDIFGYSGTIDKDISLGKHGLHLTTGFALRNDNTNIALQNAIQRKISGTIAKGIVNQINVSAYEDATFQLGTHFSLNSAVRLDYFNFDYINQVNPALTGNKSKFRISPKLNLSYKVNKHIQLFAKSGLGFHSNDARSVVNNNLSNSVPIALGYELGTEVKLLHSMFLNIAFWGLNLQSELIFVGDEGVVETNVPTRRLGIDFGLRYQMSKNFFADVDLNYNYGRLIGPPKGENYIPLAPRLTSVGGLTYKHTKGFNASIRYRYIDSRPANENNSVVAKGYFLLDALASYKIKRITLGVTAENLLNAKWNEAQFDTESRLKYESQPVSELHYTPGSPFMIKGSVSIDF